MDNDFRSVKEITTRLKLQCNKVKGIGPNHREKEQENAGATMAAYECNLLDRNAIREIAKKIEDEIGGIDVLVTCAGQSYQDIFDTATITLMSHYWVSVSCVLEAILSCHKTFIHTSFDIHLYNLLLLFFFQLLITFNSTCKSLTILFVL